MLDKGWSMLYLKSNSFCHSNSELYWHFLSNGWSFQLHFFKCNPLIIIIKNESVDYKTIFALVKLFLLKKCCILHLTCSNQLFCLRFREASDTCICSSWITHCQLWSASVPHPLETDQGRAWYQQTRCVGFFNLLG